MLCSAALLFVVAFERAPRAENCDVEGVSPGVRDGHRWKSMEINGFSMEINGFQRISMDFQWGFLVDVGQNPRLSGVPRLSRGDPTLLEVLGRPLSIYNKSL